MIQSPTSVFAAAATILLLPLSALSESFEATHLAISLALAALCAIALPFIDRMSASAPVVIATLAMTSLLNHMAALPKAAAAKMNEAQAAATRPLRDSVVHPVNAIAKTTIIAISEPQGNGVDVTYQSGRCVWVSHERASDRSTHKQGDTVMLGFEVLPTNQLRYGADLLVTCTPASLDKDHTRLG